MTKIFGLPWIVWVTIFSFVVAVGIYIKAWVDGRSFEPESSDPELSEKIDKVMSSNTFELRQKLNKIEEDKISNEIPIDNLDFDYSREDGK